MATGNVLLRGQILCGLVLLIAGCKGGDGYESGRKPNTKVEGFVEKIEVRTRRSKLFGELSKEYVITLVEGWNAYVPASRVSETALRFIGGARVTMSCYRSSEQKTCGNSVSLVVNGRELVDQ